MKAKSLDKKFDDGADDILQHFDLKKASRPNIEKERVNVDFPAWMIDDLDKAAASMGVSRQAVIKMWLAERLKIEAA
ncbi:MAG TPA: CopG family transcriptional regulator [Pseudomonadales bacterium]|nr:CopG family transcriptional regulator [Pseudomonadales bacterium]